MTVPDDAVADDTEPTVTADGRAPPEVVDGAHAHPGRHGR